MNRVEIATICVCCLLVSVVALLGLPAIATGADNGTTPQNWTTSHNGSPPNNGTTPDNGTTPSDSTRSNNGTTPHNWTASDNGTSDNGSASDDWTPPDDWNESDGGLSGVGFSGPAIVETEVESVPSDGEAALSSASVHATLWQSEPFRASVTLTGYPGVSRYELCGFVLANGTRSQAGCERVTVPSDSAERLNLTGLTWPANASGDRQLSLTVAPVVAPEWTFENETLEVTVLAEGGDVDADGLSNEEERGLGLDPLDADIDADGLTDGTEINDYGSDPRSADTDGDGVRDGQEVQAGSDPTEVDSDDDGLSDDTELTIGTDPTSPRTVEHLVVAASALLYVGASTVALRRRRRHGDGDDEEEGVGDGEADGRRGDEAPSPANASTTLDDARIDEGDAGETVERTPTLLTDEDRVRHLLDRHGGRMKQAAIIDETEWSKTKVSRLLSAMDDEGAIEKLSIGRENLISLDREWIDEPTADADADGDTDTDAEVDSDGDDEETPADSTDNPGTVTDGGNRTRTTKRDL